MLEPELHDNWPWVPAMRDCPQDPVHHGEGDVWTHTQMVYQCMQQDGEFQALPATEQRILLWAALLHDMAKPVTRGVLGGGAQPPLDPLAREAEGFSAPGHARKGAQMARQFLWQRGFPPSWREQVCGLVLNHMLPYHLVDREDWQRRLFLLCLQTRPDHLRILARADARGRICHDQQRLLDQIELFWQLAQENPLPFVDDHSRLTYFRRGGDPARTAYPEHRCQVTMMSGLPASGKDYWIGQHAGDLPVISLDQIREQLQVSPTQAQHAVVEDARERARGYLRKGQDFVWNATNLSSQMRERALSLFYDYQARVRIVYCETDSQELNRRNQARPSPVPGAALERMLSRWEIPGREEAHEVTLPW